MKIEGEIRTASNQCQSIFRIKVMADSGMLDYIDIPCNRITTHTDQHSHTFPVVNINWAYGAELKWESP